MRLYRFSPIRNESELLEAITHIHFSCFLLCKKNLGYYLPQAGNVGVFCHYDDEYDELLKLRKKLTEDSSNWNQKYFRLFKPIIIGAKDDVPETTYTYLYTRKPDIYRAQAGDIDFVLSDNEFQELKLSLQNGKAMKGVRIFDRADLDMIEVYDPDVDAVAYISTKNMAERVRVKQSDTTKL